MTFGLDRPGPAAALFGVTLALVAVGLIAASRLLATADRHLQLAGEEAARLRRELSDLERDLPLADTGRALRQVLAGRGVLSPAVRERLLQETADAVARRSLPQPYLRFAETRPAALAVPAASGIAVQASTMHMRLELGHELDLFAVTDMLDATAGALPDVRSCHLTRLPIEAVGANGPLLHADCRIDWLNITTAGKP